MTTKTLSFIAYGVSCRARAERSRYAAYAAIRPRARNSWPNLVPPFLSGLVTGEDSALCPLTDRRHHSEVPGHDVLKHATSDLDAPFAVIDLDAFDRNAADLLRRADGTPIRLASKSVRCRALIERALARRAAGDPRLHAARGAVAGRPRPRGPRRRLPHRRPRRPARARRRAVRPRDDHGRLPPSTSTSRWRPCARRAAARSWSRSTSTRAGGRSAAASASARGARRCARPSRRPRSRARCVARPELRLDGLMSYEAHIAGVGDRPPGRPLMGAAIRAMQRASLRELAPRRAAVVAAVRAVAPLRFVNGGGTGSVERTALEPAVTEVAAGSGLYGPTLFDAYTSFSPTPAALFALPVVRRPDVGTATALGGGYPASGAAGRDRLPAPHLPRGAAARPPGGRGRGPDAAARAGRRGAAGRRRGVDAPRQGGRAVRAVRLAAPGAGWRAGRRGADVSGRGRVFPVGPPNVNGGWVGVRGAAAGIEGVSVTCYQRERTTPGRIDRATAHPLPTQRSCRSPALPSARLRRVARGRASARAGARRRGPRARAPRRGRGSR